MKFPRVVGISALSLLLVIGGIVIYGMAPGSAQTETQPATTIDTVPVRPDFKPARTPPSGYSEYRSVFYRFQLLYPDTFTVSEYKEPVSAITLVFESKERPEAFQIFIVPHGDPDITEFRLSQDLPSGIMKEIQDIEIAGAKGKAFVSNREGIGETREVWFIARGFLYEATAPIGDDAWLAEILRGWEFL